RLLGTEPQLLREPTDRAAESFAAKRSRSGESTAPSRKLPAHTEQRRRMALRMFQRMGLLLIVGLMACGGEFEDDGRVAFPMRIVFNDHSAASADLELTYTL